MSISSLSFLSKFWTKIKAWSNSKTVISFTGKQILPHQRPRNWNNETIGSSYFLGNLGLSFWQSFFLRPSTQRQKTIEEGRMSHIFGYRAISTLFYLPVALSYLCHSFGWLCANVGQQLTQAGPKRETRDSLILMHKSFTSIFRPDY